MEELENFQKLIRRGGVENWKPFIFDDLLLHFLVYASALSILPVYCACVEYIVSL